MRRVATVILATIGGIALLASFHSTPGVAVRSATRPRSALQPPAGGTPPTNRTGSSSTTTLAPVTPTTGGSPNRGTAPPVTSPPATAAPVTRTIDGPVVSNRYGDVQVEIQVRAGRLVNVQAIELPSDRERSREINDVAGPDLNQEALQAGSANIDVISGATFTSYSYAQSLQAALDQAGI